MQINGQCHCHALRYRLEWPELNGAIPARACQCSYCTRFGGNWTSHPDASLEFEVADPDLLGRYRFGTKTAVFLFCRQCGITMIAISRIEGQDYAVVNINSMVTPGQLQFDQSKTDFDGESTSQRLGRRADRWIGRVKFIGL